MACLAAAPSCYAAPPSPRGAKRVRWAVPEAKVAPPARPVIKSLDLDELVNYYYDVMAYGVHGVSAAQLASGTDVTVCALAFEVDYHVFGFKVTVRGPWTRGGADASARAVVYSRDASYAAQKLARLGRLSRRLCGCDRPDRHDARWAEEPEGHVLASVSKAFKPSVGAGTDEWEPSNPSFMCCVALVCLGDALREALYELPNCDDYRYRLCRDTDAYDWSEAAEAEEADEAVADPVDKEGVEEERFPDTQPPESPTFLG